jgi:hypothetical protein
MARVHVGIVTAIQRRSAPNVFLFEGDAALLEYASQRIFACVVSAAALDSPGLVFRARQENEIKLDRLEILRSFLRIASPYSRW